MSKKRWIENEQFGEALDTSNWPNVNINNLSQKDQEVYRTRKVAVDMYMALEKPIAEIIRITGMKRENILRFVKRCLDDDGNGRIWGYRALIPQKRITKYERQLSISSADDTDNSKLTGAFSQLLNKYPSIREIIENLYFRRNKQSLTDPVMRVKHLHKKFLDACRSAGLTVNDYPFNTRTLARRSLERYVKELELRNFVEAAKRHGEESARHARTTGIADKNYPAKIRPFERVEFDGHRIDAMIAVKFHTPEGDEIIEVMERIWLLVIIDVATFVLMGTS